MIMKAFLRGSIAKFVQRNWAWIEESTLSFWQRLSLLSASVCCLSVSFVFCSVSLDHWITDSLTPPLTRSLFHSLTHSFTLSSLVYLSFFPKNFIDCKSRGNAMPRFNLQCEARLLSPAPLFAYSLWAPPCTGHSALSCHCPQQGGFTIVKSPFLLPLLSTQIKCNSSATASDSLDQRLGDKGMYPKWDWLLPGKTPLDSFPIWLVLV